MNQIQGSLYSLFLASDNAFCGAQFFLYSQFVNFNHETFHLCWSFDLNEADEVLAFSFDEYIMIAKHGQHPLNRHVFCGMLADIKASVATESHA